MIKLNKKYYFVFAGLVLIVFIILISLFYTSKGNVILSIAPYEMKLKIDSQNNIDIRNNQKIYLPKGSHVLVFNRDGFEDETKNVSIEDENSNVELLVILKAVTDKAKKLMDDNKSNYAPLYEQNATIERKKISRRGC